MPGTPSDSTPRGAGGRSALWPGDADPGSWRREDGAGAGGARGARLSCARGVPAVPGRPCQGRGKQASSGQAGAGGDAARGRGRGGATAEGACAAGGDRSAVAPPPRLPVTEPSVNGPQRATLRSLPPVCADAARPGAEESAGSVADGKESPTSWHSARAQRSRNQQRFVLL